MSDYPYNAGNMTMTIPIAKFADLHDKIKSRDAEIARLKAEVERLTKAGDALENWIAWECESPVGTAEGIRDAWNAAKEGKQP